MKIMDRMRGWLAEIYGLSPTDEELALFVRYLRGCLKI
jgi:hypothetical protein